MEYYYGKFPDASHGLNGFMSLSFSLNLGFVPQKVEWLITQWLLNSFRSVSPDFLWYVYSLLDSLTFLLWEMATVSLDPCSLSSQGRKHRKVNWLWLLKETLHSHHRTLLTPNVSVFHTNRSDTNNPALAQTPRGKGTVLWDGSHFRCQSQGVKDPQVSYDFCRTWLQMGVLTTPSSRVHNWLQWLTELGERLS